MKVMEPLPNYDFTFHFSKIIEKEILYITTIPLSPSHKTLTSPSAAGARSPTRAPSYMTFFPTIFSSFQQPSLL